MSLESNRAFYEKQWRGSWKARFMYDPNSKRDIARYVLRKAGFQDGRRSVVDIGFGFGLILFDMERSDQISGVEVAKSAIMFAEKEAPRRGFERARFYQYAGEGPLPLPDEGYDLVICSHVLEHVPDDRLLLNEIRRLLRPDGLALLIIPINEGDFRDPRHERAYTPEGFLSVAREAELSPLVTYEGDRFWNLFGWFFERDFHNRIPVLGFLGSSAVNVFASSIPFGVVKWIEENLLRGLRPRQFAACVKKQH